MKRFHSLIRLTALVIALASLAPARAQKPAPTDREVWAALRYGIFTHYVWWGNTGTPKKDGSRPANIDDCADSFDAQQYAEPAAVNK